MIELELKYKINEVPNAISKMAPNKTKNQSDIYFDTKNYDLISGGNFLRVRNNRSLDFKLGTVDTTHLYCKESSFLISEFEERFSDINNIFESLGLAGCEFAESFAEFVKHNDFEILAPIEKTREEFKIDDDITISIDNVSNLGLFLEAEIMIDANELSKQQADVSRKKLENKLNELGVFVSGAKEVNVGYVELYLIEHNKQAYEKGMFKI